MHLQQILENVHYLSGASNVGLVIGEGQNAVLIDSGVGRRSGRQIFQMLTDLGLKLAAILNTHGHGDHVGGNAYLVEKTGARVYAPRYDAVIMADPLWGTLCTFGGAEPIDELRLPRFSPEPCAVDVVVADGTTTVAGIPFEVVSLPGHTASHVGYIVNRVFFTGDALAGPEELSGSPVSYAYSVGQCLQSLEKLRRFSCSWYVPGHGAVLQDIQGVIDLNVAQINRMLDAVQASLDGSAADSSDIMVGVCRLLGLELHSTKHYYLLSPTLHSALSYLSNSGRIHHTIRNNRMLWSKVAEEPMCCSSTAP